MAVGAASAAGDKRGDRLVVSCPIQKPEGIYHSVGVELVGDQVYVTTGPGSATLVAAMSSTSRRIVVECHSDRPVRRDLRGLAGPWPRRLPNLMTAAGCSWEDLGGKVVLDFNKLRDKRGRVIGNSLLLAYGRRPLIRVTATRKGGGVWLDPTVCGHSITQPPPR